MAKKEKKEKEVMKIPNVITITGKGAWYCVEEHLPARGKVVLAYSTVFRCYNLAKFNAVSGWMDARTTNPFRAITHWLDMDIPFIFPADGETDEDEAKKHGLEKDCYGRYA